jgi:hypothetical protein
MDGKNIEILCSKSLQRVNNFDASGQYQCFCIVTIGSTSPHSSNLLRLAAGVQVVAAEVTVEVADVFVVPAVLVGTGAVAVLVATPVADDDLNWLAIRRCQSSKQRSGIWMQLRGKIRCIRKLTAKLFVVPIQDIASLDRTAALCTTVTNTV